jgi:hypothetical protein
MAAVAYRAMLGRLGFTADAQAFISDVDRGGFDTLESLDVLVSGDPTGGNFVKSMRRPGGDSSNGVLVSFKAETNFKSLLFYLRHKKRTNRTVRIQDITLANISALAMRQEKEKEDKANFVTPEAPDFDPDDWAQSAENVMDFVSKHPGVTGIPLSYVLRDKLRVKAEADDPAFGLVDSVYASMEEEMVSRASILSPTAVATMSDELLEEIGPYTDTFLMDSAKVYDLLTTLFGTKEYYTYIRNAGKKKDSTNGRNAWFALFKHFVGPNFLEHVQSTSETTLRNLRYNGEGKKFNYEQFVTAQKREHHRLDNLEKHGGRKLSESEKLRYFKQGLQHSSLENIKIFIANDAACRASYDKSVDAVKEFIRNQMQAVPSALRVASVGVENHASSLTADEIAECDMWMKQEDWDKKPHAEKKRIIELRKTLRNERKQNGVAPNPTLKKAISKVRNEKKKSRGLKRKNEKLKRKISAMSRVVKEEHDSSDDDDSVEEHTNANHPALTRGAAVKKKGKKKRKS